MLFFAEIIKLLKDYDICLLYNGHYSLLMHSLIDYGYVLIIKLTTF